VSEINITKKLLHHLNVLNTDPEYLGAWQWERLYRNCSKNPQEIPKGSLLEPI